MNGIIIKGLSFIGVPRQHPSWIQGKGSLWNLYELSFLQRVLCRFISGANNDPVDAVKDLCYEAEEIHHYIGKSCFMSGA
jgi:hypothetical protein